jgi:tripartite-type tricarboxylate transporter receptor subunit TctC
MRFLIAAALALLLLSSAADAQAQAYPSRPLSFVVPLPPGGTADVVTRVIAEHMARKLGQPVVVENKPGASTMLGTGQVARSAPDGYTLIFATDAIAVNAVLGKDVPYDGARDLEGVSRLATLPLVVVARPYERFDSLRAALQAVRANPGKLNVATVGVGTPHYIAVEWLKKSAGIDVVNVPYQGTAPLVAALLAGEIELAVVTLAGVQTHAEARKLRVLATTGAEPAGDIPTVAEQAGIADFAVNSWFGVALRAGTPAAIVQRLNAEVTDALAQPVVQERLRGAGLQVAPSTAAAMTALLRDEIEKYRRIVALTGISRP